MRKSLDGIVIREVNSKEDDRLLSILTRDHGVIDAYARGAKRMKSKLLSSTELLCYSRFELFSYKGHYTVDDSESIRVFFGIREDIEKLSLAAYFSQICRDLVPEGESSPLYLRLFLNSLHLLEKGSRSPLFLKPMFELRMLTMSGYMPDLVGCSVCGQDPKDAVWFSPLLGTICCSQCTPPQGSDWMLLPAGVLAAMRHILYSEFEKLFQFTLSPKGLVVLEEASEKYLKTQLERTFPALEFLQPFLADLRRSALLEEG